MLSPAPMARGQHGHVYDLLWKMMIAALMGLGSAFGYWMERASSATMAESRRAQLNLAILTVKLLKVCWERCG